MGKFSVHKKTTLLIIMIKNIFDIHAIINIFPSIHSTILSILQRENGVDQKVYVFLDVISKLMLSFWHIKNEEIIFFENVRVT